MTFLTYPSKKSPKDSRLNLSTSQPVPAMDAGSLMAPVVVYPKRMIVHFPSGRVVFKTSCSFTNALRSRIVSFPMIMEESTSSSGPRTFLSSRTILIRELRFLMRGVLPRRTSEMSMACLVTKRK